VSLIIEAKTVKWIKTQHEYARLIAEMEKKEAGVKLQI
jgi:hypothetical protein